ncbi:hypothetical protein AB0I28_07415 [Phytomonospora sp. NPDC050363]|uniref:hypothetical protein n=1 Tax=Phytomonospora sp. NPDC050363 TaxID=3155642 RepID=UPI0033C35073
MRQLDAIADRILRALVPADVKAAAGCPIDSWTENQTRQCPGGTMYCTRDCRLLPSCAYSCTEWSCSACMT